MAREDYKLHNLRTDTNLIPVPRSPPSRAVTLINRRLAVFRLSAGFSPFIITESLSPGRVQSPITGASLLSSDLTSTSPKVYILDSGPGSCGRGSHFRWVISESVTKCWWCAGPRLRRRDWRWSLAPTPGNKSHTPQRRRPADGDNHGTIIYNSLKYNVYISDGGHTIIKTINELLGYQITFRYLNIWIFYSAFGMVSFEIITSWPYFRVKLSCVFLLFA